MSEKVVESIPPVSVAESNSAPLVESTSALVEENIRGSNEPVPKKKKINLPRSVRDYKKITPEPARTTPAIYTQDVDGNVIQEPVVITGTNSKEFQISNNKRVASRATFHDTLMRDALKMKNVCNDSVTVTITKWKDDLKENEPIVRKYSTEPHFARDLSPDSPAPSTSVPDRGTLVNSSPSVRRLPTARSMSKKKSHYCQKCDDRYHPDDDKTDPWVGCKAVKQNGEKCDVWKHASCTGWYPVDNFVVATMPNWYCHKHRPRKMSTGNKAKKSAPKKSVAKKSAPKKSGPKSTSTPNRPKQRKPLVSNDDGPLFAYRHIDF
jgi:hypothetical protein